MEYHTLESTEGARYAEMGRFPTPSGEDTSDEALAAKTDDGRPVENGLRNMWVTETALTTALNTAFFAERVAVFSIVMGIALLLTGIGFFILTLGRNTSHCRSSARALPRRRPRPEHHRGYQGGGRAGCPPFAVSHPDAEPRRLLMTLIWFVIWLVANTIGDAEAVTFDLVNFWAGSFLFALALDLGRQHAPELWGTRSKLFHG